ncbi:hypothetical protein BDR05DRAFT_937281 [Suillus weaverae]|nr:hypothetical protein BDR05DRAFT_937281 [Suillus weaverae]
MASKIDEAKDDRWKVETTFNSHALVTHGSRHIYIKNRDSGHLVLHATCMSKQFCYNYQLGFSAALPIFTSLLVLQKCLTAVLRAARLHPNPIRNGPADIPVPILPFLHTSLLVNYLVMH